MTVVFTVPVFYRITKLIYVYRFSAPPDFLKFGKWAIVTGATDGIGREYAIALSHMKMNVVLISRDQERLKKTAADLHPGVQCLTISQDLSIMDTSIYESIAKTVSKLDVGVLVNNVGMGLGVHEFESLTKLG